MSVEVVVRGFLILLELESEILSESLPSGVYKMGNNLLSLGWHMLLEQYWH